MINRTTANLRDCSQFRQTLLAKPPALVHGTAILLVVLVTAASAWTAMTQANLVIHAPGRVRPENRVFQVFVPDTVERPGYSVGGQVQEVLYSEGDTVSKGQVLLRLNTELLNEEQAKLESTIENCNAEIARLKDQKGLLTKRFNVALSKAKTELLQTQEEVAQAKESREIELRRSDAELKQTMMQANRIKKAWAKQVASDFEVDQAQLKVVEAQAKLELAQQPILERKVESRRSEVELVEREYALQSKEHELALMKKEAEYQRAKKELATLERECQRALLRSPIDGIVTNKPVKAGDVLKRGAPVVEIAEQGVLYFEATVSTKEASHLQQGMPVRIKLDAYDYQWYGTLPAKVTFISPDSRVAPDGNGNRVRYDVRISIEQTELRRGELQGDVQLGLTGTAEIITDRKSILSILRKNIQRSISLG